MYSRAFIHSYVPLYLLKLDSNLKCSLTIIIGLIIMILSQYDVAAFQWITYADVTYRNVIKSE